MDSLSLLSLLSLLSSLSSVSAERSLSDLPLPQPRQTTVNSIEPAPARRQVTLAATGNLAGIPASPLLERYSLVTVFSGVLSQLLGTIRWAWETTKNFGALFSISYCWWVYLGVLGDRRKSHCFREVSLLNRVRLSGENFQSRLRISLEPQNCKFLHQFLGYSCLFPSFWCDFSPCTCDNFGQLACVH